MLGEAAPAGFCQNSGWKMSRTVSNTPTKKWCVSSAAMSSSTPAVSSKAATARRTTTERSRAGAGDVAGHISGVGLHVVVDDELGERHNGPNG